METVRNNNFSSETGSQFLYRRTLKVMAFSTEGLFQVTPRGELQKLYSAKISEFYKA
jgi:hypothetical protein